MSPNSVDGKDDTLSVGVVGAGHIARHYHLPILANMDDVRVGFIADIDEKKARDLGTTYDGQPIGVTELGDLPECDVALLAIPVGARADYFDGFETSSTSVFAEKPFAINSDQHREFRESVDMVACNFMRLQFRSTRLLRRLVCTEPFGEVERVRAVEGAILGATGKEADHYQTDVSLSGGGILIQNGCHPLSQICHLFDGSPFEVSKTSMEWYDDFDVDVGATLQVDWNDQSIPIEYQVSSIRNLGSELRVVFEHATVSVDPADPTSPVTVKPKEPPAGVPREFTVSVEGEGAKEMSQAHYARWRSFLDLVKGEGEGPVMPTGEQVTTVIDRIYRKSQGSLTP